MCMFVDTVIGSKYSLLREFIFCKDMIFLGKINPLKILWDLFLLISIILILLTDEIVTCHSFSLINILGCWRIFYPVHRLLKKKKNLFSNPYITSYCILLYMSMFSQ